VGFVARKSSTGAKGRSRATKASKSRRTFSVVLEEDEDGYVIASVPELRGCHTQGRTIDEAMTNIREAIQLCLEDDAEPSSTRFLGVAVATVDHVQTA
jgi:predicted RNase H-like HicB family nuclease